MSGLFARIFIWFWVALMGVSVGFVLIAAATFPEERRERFEARMADSALLRGQRALAMLAKDPAAEPQLGGFPEQVAWLVQGERVLLPRGAVVPPEVLVLAARVAPKPEGTLERMETDDQELLGVAIGDGHVVVSGRRPMSPFDALADPAALPWRLLLVIVVSGLVAGIIARHLTRPVRALRTATGKIAAGDLAARVGPEVARAGGELAALGRDFDLMAERIEHLLASQRRLLGDVSHELRSPLARLGVALELARKRSGPEARGDLDRIERESERLATLIGEILTLTKLETAEAAERAADIDIAGLVREVADDVDYEARGSNRSVVVAAPDALPGAARPETLRRAVENVLRNAVRFTAEGTAVDVAVVPSVESARGEERRVVTITIADHGPGVPEDALEAIFRPFYRVGEDRDRKTGGAGIGLAIVQRAVELHGGTVVAQNRKGPDGATVGLEVVMRLPVG